MFHQSNQRLIKYSLTPIFLVLLASAGVFAETLESPRVVSLAPALTELVFAAGAGNTLVGVVEYSDYPKEALEIPRVGDAFRIDVERVLAMEPDIVLAWPSGNPAPMLEQLESLGLRVELFEAERLDDIPVQIRAIGTLLGTSTTADTAAEEFETDLAQRARAPSPPIRAFVQIQERPLFTVGGTQIISEVLDVCGAENIFSDLPEKAAAVDIEAVIARDPELIIRTTGPGTALTDWNRWPDLAARRYDAIIDVSPDYLSRPTPRLLQGMSEICEAVADVDHRRQRQ